jgi:hypothetical protein
MAQSLPRVSQIQNAITMKKNLFALCALGATMFFTSCEKNDDDATASLLVVNASPNGTNIDASANGSVIASNIAYPSNSGYKSVTAGNVNVVVKQTGTNTEIINGTLATEAKANYTLYVVDSAHKRRAAFTRDDLSAPAAGKAKIRLLHLSPNAASVDVLVNGATATNFSNRNFNDFATNANYAAFTEVNAAGLAFQINLAGSSTAVATIPAFTVQAGKIYTFIIKGFAGVVGTQGLGVEVITHN